jgi:sulfur carrier protein ThiS
MFKDSIKKVPGFRTGSKWKMILATIMYLATINMLIGVSGVTFRDKVIGAIEILIVIGVPFGLITNVGNIRNRLPVFNNKSIQYNILGGIIALAIMGAGIIVVGSLKSPEQKQFELIALEKSNDIGVAAKLDAKIVALGDLSDLTLDEADTVEVIRSEYEELTSEQKEFVTKLDDFVLAEEKIADLKISDK